MKMKHGGYMDNKQPTKAQLLAGRIAFLKEQYGAKNADEWKNEIERDSGKSFNELNDGYKKWKNAK